MNVKEEIIEKIKQLALENKKNYLSSKDFLTKYNISIKKIIKNFGSWNNAIQMAGLMPLSKSGKPDIIKGYEKEEIIEKIKSTALKLGKNSLTLHEFCKETGISERPIYRFFKNWNMALEECNLEKDKNYNLKIENTEMINEYIEIYNKLGKHPSYSELIQMVKYSIGTYENRFGGIKKFRKAAINYGIKNNIILPEIEFENEGVIEKNYNLLSDRPVLGEEINFRGLLHGPTNELGVVYLFGMISSELGFKVELIQSTFPDCTAKIKVKGGWQNIKVEFEYKSSNFITHGHDVSKCDMIICWENNWKDCPIPVISLKEKIKELSKKI
jgi:hypothetical protein